MELKAAFDVATPQDMQEMMDNWNKLCAVVKWAFPEATEDELYEKTKAAMNLSLGLAADRIKEAH